MASSVTAPEPKGTVLQQPRLRSSALQSLPLPPSLTSSAARMSKGAAAAPPPFISTAEPPSRGRPTCSEIARPTRSLQVEGGGIRGAGNDKKRWLPPHAIEESTA